MEGISVILRPTFTLADMMSFAQEKGGGAVDVGGDRASIDVEGGGLYLDYVEDLDFWETDERESFEAQLGSKNLVAVAFHFRYSNPSYRLAFLMADEMVERWGAIIDDDGMPRTVEEYEAESLDLVINTYLGLEG